MPKRFLSALIMAATCWSLATLGNAQGLMGRRNPLTPMNAQPGAYATAGNGAAPGAPTGGYPTPSAYPAPGGSGAIGYGMGDAMGMIADPNRKLQPGDQLSFRIEQDREAPVFVMVSQAGEVAIEPLPQTVRIAGLTLTQATGEIKRQLEKDYYFSATVRLSLERASVVSAGQISLSGYVNRVGPVPLYADRPMKVSAAILLAGGFRQFANESGVRVTRVDKEGKAEIFVVDVKAVLQKGKVEKDRVVQDGDQIFVPANIFQY